MKKVVIVVALCVIGIAYFFVDNKEKPDERFRPLIHFTPQENWMNDPNGMFYYDGEYHLFYQYNPFGNTWGHMSWGHAVSTDLVHWEHLPVALPEEDRVMIFSGSAVVDWDNTSGFGTIDNPPIVAIYTGYHEATGIQEQSIAFSTDKGRTWSKYSKNPVIDLGLKNFRDPKVIWYEPEQKWVMVVALPMDRYVQFYSSTDLKSWELMSTFGPLGSVKGQWECPDLFPIIADDGKEKWVLEVDVDSGAPAGGSGGQYFIGTFDGTSFISDGITAENNTPYIPEGVVIENFENDLSNWDVKGTAFLSSPASGTLPSQNEVTGYFNKKFINSFHNGDGATGTMTSKPFLINHQYINFLIGGGVHADTAVQLLVEDKVTRTASGNNSELLEWVNWEVAELQGKEAQIRIVDNNTGGWGHVNVDHIHLSNIPAYNIAESADWVDYGKDFYAGVSWSDVPQSDGRRIWLAWMNNWQYAQEIPTGKWRSSMSFPRTISLKNKEGKYVIKQQYVEELNRVLEQQIRGKDLSMSSVNEELEKQKPHDAFYSTMKWSSEDDMSISILNNDNSAAFELVYVAEDRKLIVSRTTAGNIDFHARFPSVQVVDIDQSSEFIDIELLVDVSSAEVLAQDGTISFTNQIFPTTEVIKYHIDVKKETLLKEFTYAKVLKNR